MNKRLESRISFEMGLFSVNIGAFKETNFVKGDMKFVALKHFCLPKLFKLGWARGRGSPNFLFIL
jgi:hypothetical protein